MMFSFVAFAKRPLRLSELYELICIYSSENPKAIDLRKKPGNIEKLFNVPLIELQQDPRAPTNPLCRLPHSTVKDFLLDNPNVLDHHPIDPWIIARACLLYLSQDRYAGLLHASQPQAASGDQGEARWFTVGAVQEDIADHQLLTYAAKYWDKRMYLVVC